MTSSKPDRKKQATRNGSSQLEATSPVSVTKTASSSRAQTCSGDNRFSVLLLALVAASLAGWFVGLGSYGILDPGDGYFSEAAREMIEAGEYLVPKLNYQMFFSKPILAYWLICFSYKLFGVTELAARLPSAVLASILVAATAFIGAIFRDRMTGLLAALILASAPLYVTFARMSMVDMPFVFFLSIAVYATALAVTEDRFHWWPLIYISMGLAILTKGPVAVLLFALCLCFFLAASAATGLNWTLYLKRLHPVEGAIITTLVAAPWYVLVGLKTNWLWPRVFLVFENFGRFLGSVNHNHPSPLYYVLVFLYGFFPWVFFLPPAFKALLFTDRNSARRPGLFLLVSWIASVFIFFTLSAAKVNTYILPSLPACAVVVALYLRLVWDGRLAYWSRTSTVFLVAGIACITLAVVAGCLQSLPSAQFLPASALVTELASVLVHLPAWFVPAATAAVLVAGLGFVLQGVFTLSGRNVLGLQVFFTTVAFGCLIGAHMAFAAGYELREHALHQLIRCLVDRPGEVAFFREFKPSVMFYLERPVDTFFSTVNLARRKDLSASFNLRPKGDENLYVIASSLDADELQRAYPGCFVVFSRNDRWSILLSTSMGLIPLPTLKDSFSPKITLSHSRYHWGTLPFAGGAGAGNGFD